MNAEQLWETTMNPETRSLIQVKIDDLADAESEIDILMGNDALRRRNWLENHVSFTLEGDSAGGSAKQGRDRRYQAILPLRGKVLNTERASADAVLKNEEIATMIYTIGADYGDSFDLKKCNYKKIIIMTDADDDGAHIQVLLLTFFFRYMRPLIEDGRVYIALPPLFKITKRGKKRRNHLRLDQ